MDRRWLFRTPPIHQGGGATVTAHDFKREPICQLQWGLSTSNEFFQVHFGARCLSHGGCFEDRHEATSISLALS
jgi:hypothetical protein